MPTGNLPDKPKALYEQVYKEAISSGDSEETAAKKAWGAVKAAGWSKDAEGNWIKKAQIDELSLTITRASFDKQTGNMRWFAVASDTDDDLYDDNMTMELFDDFIGRISNNELAPEEFRSEFWSGGMPYLSLSHYSDINGKAVPGMPERVYIDGNELKANGTFNDTELGRACFKAVCDDLYGVNKSNTNKVRISIAFLDWKHKHKDTNTVFERKSLDDICMECLYKAIKGTNGSIEFQNGQLVHLALTRVPVNERTKMEVDKSMTTQKEDAASIVPDELVEAIENEKAKLVGKSEALVIKAEQPKNNKDVKDAAEDNGEDECEEGESPEDCQKRMNAAKKKSNVTEFATDWVSELKAELAEIKSLVAPKPEEPKPIHALDGVFSVLRSKFDEASVADVPVDDKLRMIQDPFNAVGETIQNSLKNVPEEVVKADHNMQMLSEALQPIYAKLDLLAAQITQKPVQPTATPVRRSVDPALVQTQLHQKAKAFTGTMSVRDLVERTT
jgi:hypothetical protein